MASEHNHQFQISPQSFLARQVLFTDELLSPDCQAVMANRMIHPMDIEPIVTSVNTRSKLRVLKGLHEYSDMHMMSYVLPVLGVALIPKKDPPHRLVFMPEFTCCRLLVKDDEGILQVSLERGLTKLLPPPENYCDSFNYWETVTDDLVGKVRGNAVLYKERDQPWQFIMQQVVGPQGAELVRKTFTRPLRYSSAV